MENYGGWYWFSTGEKSNLTSSNWGKWMYFFKDQDHAIDICKQAISQKVCYECKCTNMEDAQATTGVICFYVNIDDNKHHRKVIEFMLENNLIRKTKTGKLYNISFKLDEQTLAGEYGSNFEGQLKLDHFIDLKTGKWILDE